MKVVKNCYTYKALKDGSASVYCNGVWVCIIDEGIERAKVIFESV